METNFNLGSLKIVQSSLIEYFQIALKNIDSNLILLREEKKIPTNIEAIDYLSKSQKTLNIIGLKGLAKILALTEEALIEVRNVNFDSKKTIEILELSSEIVKNSSIYLQKLLNSGFDQPISFFNEYQKMATLLNKEVFIKDLFYPKLEFNQDVSEQIQNDLKFGIFINDNSKKNLKGHLEKVSNIVNSKMPKIIDVFDNYGEFVSEESKQDYQNNCKTLYEAFDLIQKLKINKNCYILFGIYKLYICILSPIFNKNFTNYVTDRKEIIKYNLFNIQTLLKSLNVYFDEMENGEKTGSIKLDEEIIKEILVEIVYAINKNKDLKEMLVYKELEKFFDLDYYNNQLTKTFISSESSIFNEEKTAEIEKKFLDLKEDFNLLILKSTDNVEYKQYIVKSVNNTNELSRLTSSIKELSSLLKELTDSFELLRNNEIELTSIIKKEISLALVLIEYGINNFIKKFIDTRFIKDYDKQIKIQIHRLKLAGLNREEELSEYELPRLDIISQKSDEKKTYSKIFEQINIDLINIEEILDFFLKNEGENIEEVSSIYKPLVSMQGLFNIIGKKELSKIINKIAEPWKKIVEQYVKAKEENQDNEDFEYEVNYKLEYFKESISLLSGLSLLVKSYVDENEVAAEELYNNLLKIFYKNNQQELESLEVNQVQDLQTSIIESPFVTEEKVEDFNVSNKDFDNSEEFINKDFEESEKFTISLNEEIHSNINLEELNNENNEGFSLIDEIEESDFFKANIEAIKNFTEKPQDLDLIDVFLIESKDILSLIKTSLDNLENDFSNEEEITNLRRYFHTLKGNSSMVGLEYMAEAGNITEQTLNKCLSNELDFNIELFNLIKDMNIYYEQWNRSLKKKGKVSVDLKTIKNKFLKINPTLNTNIEIEEDVNLNGFLEKESNLFFDEDNSNEEEQKTTELDIQEKDLTFSFDEDKLNEEESKTTELDIQEKESNLFFDEDNSNEEEQKTTELDIQEKDLTFSFDEDKFILIDGINVSRELFNIYEEESNNNINELKDYVHNEYSEPVVLTEDFMRHVHTLSSISASVNLKKIANIANKLEKISLVTKERKIALSQIQMNLIRHVVDNLDLFKKIDTSEHSAYYQSLIDKLENLIEDLNSDIVEEKEIFIKEKDTNISSEYLNEFKKELLKEFDLLRNENKTLLETLNNKLSEIESLNNKIKNFESVINTIKEDGEEKEKVINKALTSSKNDIRTLANIVKKKSRLSFYSSFQRTIQKNQAINTSGELYINNSIEEKNNSPINIKNEEILEFNLIEESHLIKNNVEELPNEEIQEVSLIEETNTEELLNEEIQELSLIEETNTEELINEEIQELSLIEETNTEELINEEIQEVSLIEETPNEELIKEEIQELSLIEETNTEELINEEIQEVSLIEETNTEELIKEEIQEVSLIEETPNEELNSYNKEILEVSLIEETNTEELLKEEIQEVSLIEETNTEELLKEEIQEVFLIEETNTEELINEEIQEVSLIEETNTEELNSYNKEILELSLIEETNTEELNSYNKEILELLTEHEGINIIFEEKVAPVLDELDDDIFEISKVEAEEMLENINSILDIINETGLSNNDGLELKRYLHTLKGSVRMAGANKVGMLAHRLESLIDYVETRKINFFKVKLLLEKEVDKITFLLKDPKQKLSEDKIKWLDQIVDSNILSNQSYIETNLVISTKENQVDSIDKKLTKDVKRDNKQYIRVLSSVVDTAINDVGEIRLARNSLENNNLNNRKSLFELKNSYNKLSKMVKEIELQAEMQIQSQSTKIDEKSDNFDPLEFDRFTRLQEITRLMNEAVADIEETVHILDINAKVQDNTINEQSIVTNNLLAELMKVRLVSVESVSDRFYKIARNTSKELGKKVTLQLVGEKTEIDKFLLDKIISPIEHILRNSIAHGIELPENRVAKNKPQIGKISLEISVEGNYTMIKIVDDGAGINIEKVKEIALNKGIINEHQEYSKEEMVNLIFHSGFSTADNVSQLSGRGVGMDVVKSEILSIGGTVKIDTEKDIGTTFRLLIPMDVATNQSMLCYVKNKLTAIPALLIEEVISLKEKDLKKAYEEKTVKINNKNYPLYYTGNLLGISREKVFPEIKTYNSLIRVKYGAESIVLHFDKVLTTSEILIKPIGSIYGKINGLLGVTILGDGKQGIVINPIQLLEHYNKNIKNIIINSSQNDILVNDRLTVMVVDDSITVRRASSKILERNNFNIVLAKDGEDALEQLQIVKPDIILSDIEMPKMDGFEFVKNVRSIDKYNNTPIIMISSRTAEKHQQHAFDLGANDFLGKPYKEEELIFKIEYHLEKMKENYK